MTDSNQADEISICLAIYKAFNKNNNSKEDIKKKYIPEINSKLSRYNRLLTAYEELNDKDNIKILKDKILKQEDEYKKIEKYLTRLEELIKIDVEEYNSHCSDNIKILVSKQMKEILKNKTLRTSRKEKANKEWNDETSISLRQNSSPESRSQKVKGKPEARKISCKKDTDCIKPNSQRKYKCVEGFCKLSKMRAIIDEKKNTIRKFTNS